jgi:hypothetical protein
LTIPVADLVTLELADPISNSLTSGFRRIHPDGTSVAMEYVAPYGYVIPAGKCLVVTSVAFYSGFTNPQPPGSLTHVMLGIATVNPGGGWGQRQVFATPAVFANNGAIGGNVTLETGIAVKHGHYLTVSFLNSDLVSAYFYVYGYLAAA